MLKAIRNFLGHRRERQLRKEAIVFSRLQKAYEDGIDRLVQLVEPGSRRLFYEKNNTSYYELEHRYGVHIWVYAAVNAIAEKSATPPLIVEDKDGEMMDSPLPMRPNPLHTWNELEQLIAIWLELTGNAYVYHDTDTDEFFPMRPSRVRIVPDEDGRSVLGYAYNRLQDTSVMYTGGHSGGKSGWLYDDPEVMNWSRKDFYRAYEKRYADYKDYMEKGSVGVETVSKGDMDNWIPYEANEVLHFKFVSPTHDYYGIPPIYPLLTNLETELFARQWNKNFFENGAIPPGVLIIPKILPKDEFDSVKKNFIKQYGGTKNRGKPLVLQGGEVGADYKAFPGQHRDLEFLNGLDHGRDETLAVFNVPPEVLGISIGAAHGGARSPGIREKKKIFWQDTVMPKNTMKASRWTTHWQDRLPEGHRFTHDYNGIEDLEPDWGERAKAAAVAIKSGMTVKEVRRDIYKLPEDWEGVLLLPANVNAYQLSASPEQPQLVQPSAPSNELPSPTDDDELPEDDGSR